MMTRRKVDRLTVTSLSFPFFTHHPNKMWPTDGSSTSSSPLKILQLQLIAKRKIMTKGRWLSNNFQRSTTVYFNSRHSPEIYRKKSQRVEWRLTYKGFFIFLCQTMPGLPEIAHPKPCQLLVTILYLNMSSLRMPK